MKGKRAFGEDERATEGDEFDEFKREPGAGDKMKLQEQLLESCDQACIFASWS